MLWVRTSVLVKLHPVTSGAEGGCPRRPCDAPKYLETIIQKGPLADKVPKFNPARFFLWGLLTWKVYTRADEPMAHEKIFLVRGIH
jgi:hypothetical protein